MTSPANGTSSPSDLPPSNGGKPPDNNGDKTSDNSSTTQVNSDINNHITKALLEETTVSLTNDNNARTTQKQNKQEDKLSKTPETIQQIGDYLNLQGNAPDTTSSGVTNVQDYTSEKQ